MKKIWNSFTAGERKLWSGSVCLIILFFLCFDRTNYLTLTASLIGVTSLIFNARGNPFGQFLMIVFSILYGIISYTFSYYGEMITYLGMTGPMALFAWISWLRHPFAGNHAEVAVNHLKKAEYVLMPLLTLLVTAIFYVLLRYFGTANLIPSTLSVATSFVAVYLTFRRSSWFALAYAANDVVLIYLWAIASMHNSAYLSVTLCFLIFLINDLYGWISWRNIRKRQQTAQGAAS